MISDDEAISYVQVLLQHFPEQLSEWEDTFCRNLKLNYVDTDRPLTDKQREKLDAIMERCAQQHGRRW